MSTATESSPYTPTWSGPGVMQAIVTLRKDSKLSQETLEKWFHEVYFPAVLKTGIAKTTTTWRAVDPNYERPLMFVSEVENMELIQYGDQNHKVGGGLHNIPRKSELFPTDGPVDDFVDFESRLLSQIESYGDSGTLAADEVDTMIYAAMQPKPGGEKDLDDWYRTEHNAQMSKEPGYQRTTRYSPLFQTRNIEGAKPTGLNFVAFHQFGIGNKIGTEVEPLDPITDWTKKSMGECTSIDAAIYRKVKTLTA
ncbi:hypothetical protein BU23DRAFT_552042 [Bimuria novae-zelandiae CBS 107.79]|uniref:EthD domain-containing protein n=1 Tax=Bimuria novae-zelandiae CBS 107.79 TaxID=1447943 RepID=A0A6A5VLZ2_9PLEO|nr:hypothetical protein BU23DRAFT_552042 [Bimuria novae-zelandiae CBS 107.79]